MKIPRIFQWLKKILSQIQSIKKKKSKLPEIHEFLQSSLKKTTPGKSI